MTFRTSNLLRAGVALCLFSIFFLSTSAEAQAPSQSTPPATNVPMTLTLSDAIARAMAENYTVQTTANDARRNDIEVTRSRDNAWLPTAGASGSWGYSYSLEPASSRTLSVLQTTQVFVPTSNGDSILVNGVAPNAPVIQVISPAGALKLAWNATAAYNIFHGGSDVSQISAAEANFGASQHAAFWTRQATAFTVTQDYLDILRNNELVVSADSTLAEAQAQLTLVQGQYNAGVVPIGQVYTQKAVVEQDSLALIQANVNYQNAKATLLFALNVAPNQYMNYVFSTVGIDTSTVGRAAVDTTITDAQLNAVIDRRPDILAQEQTIDAYLFKIDVTRGSLLPSLDASAGISGAGTNTDLTKVQMNNGLSVGLTLSV